MGRSKCWHKGRDGSLYAVASVEVVVGGGGRRRGNRLLPTFFASVYRASCTIGYRVAGTMWRHTLTGVGVRACHGRACTEHDTAAPPPPTHTPSRCVCKCACARGALLDSLPTRWHGGLTGMTSVRSSRPPAMRECVARACRQTHFPANNGSVEFHQLAALTRRHAGITALPGRRAAQLLFRPGLE